MTFYNAPVESFLEKMSDKRFGIFLIIGKADSEKTEMLKKYFGKVPDSVRKTIVSSSPELQFFGEYEKRNISCVKVASSSLVPDILEKFLSMRSPAIGVDVSEVFFGDKTEREILEICAMASISANVSINLPYGSLEDFHENMEDMFASPEANLTYSGFIKRIKGIAFLEKGSELDGEPLFVQCVEFDESVKSFVSREHSTETFASSLKELGKTQGYPAISDQKNAGIHPQAPRATALAWKEFLKSEENIAVITGGVGSGKSTLEDSLALLAEEAGEKVLYCSGRRASIQKIMEQEGFEESTLIVIDELDHSVSMLHAMDLAEDRKILFAFDAPNHYTAIKRLQLGISEMSDGYLNVFNQQLGLVLLTYKDGFKRKSSPLIIEETERNDLSKVMSLEESVAGMIVSQMVSDQGFDS